MDEEEFGWVFGCEEEVVEDAWEYFGDLCGVGKTLSSLLRMVLSLVSIVVDRVVSS